MGMSHDERIQRIIKTSILPNVGFEDNLFNYGAQTIKDAPDPFILTRSDPVNTVRQYIAPLIEQYIKYGELQINSRNTINKVRLIEVRSAIHGMKRTINMELETAKLLIKRRQQKCTLAVNHTVLLELDIAAAKHYLSTNTSDVLSRCIKQLEFHYDKYKASIVATQVEIDASILMLDAIDAFMLEIVKEWDKNIMDVGRTLDLKLMDQERKKWTAN